MVRLRYSAGRGRLDAGARVRGLFDEVARELPGQGDVAAARGRVLGRGIDGLIGLDEIRAHVRACLDDLYGTYDPSGALDDLHSRLATALAREKLRVARAGEGDGGSERRRFLGRLPLDVDGMLARLAYYEPLDPVAASEIDTLSSFRAVISRAASFQRRFGALFHGNEQLGLDALMALADQVEGLRELHSRLAEGNLAGATKVAGRAGPVVCSAVGRVADVLTSLLATGLVVWRGERLALTLAGVRRVGEMALRELHRNPTRRSAGRHRVALAGSGEWEPGSVREYRYGEGARVAAEATVANAVRRGQRPPLRLRATDLAVHEGWIAVRAATVLLLDMSWSMSWEGRFTAAKRVALALTALSRSRFPDDYFAVIGFSTRAVEIPCSDLADVTWSQEEPFTNLQDAVRLGGKLLMRRRDADRQMLLITDGQPTAYSREGAPVHERPWTGGTLSRAALEALAEVKRATRSGIRINTFMLDDGPVVREFVGKLTALNRGRVFYTTPQNLGRFLLVDYVERCRKVI